LSISSEFARTTVRTRRAQIIARPLDLEIIETRKLCPVKHRATSAMVVMGKLLD
jgi:hypothetical protein